MENASKALIIAGAILIAILLISVGIMVMNSMNRPINQAEGIADSQAIEMFNSKFTPYVGDNKSASSVKSLFTLVNSNTDSKHNIVFYDGQSNGKTAITSASSIESSNTYTVKAFFYPTNKQTTDEEGNTSGVIDFSGKKSEDGYIYAFSIYKN